MGDTINEFILFVTNNPLMLGLCIAIVILFIILIIVLFSGKKTTKEVVETPTEGVKNDEVKDNSVTSYAAAETPPEENAFTMDNIQSTFDDINKENAEAEGPALFTEEEAPINIDEALNLKEKAVEQPVEETVFPVPVELKKEESLEKAEVPVLEATPVQPVAPVFPTTFEETVPNASGVNNDISEFDNLLNEINNVNNKPVEEDLQDTNFQSILPSDDLDKTIVSNTKQEVNLNQLFEDDNFLNPDKKEESKPNIDAPFGSLDIDPNRPNIFDDIPKEEPKNNDWYDEDDNLDDIELPKFKDEANNVLNNLKGESFSIE